MQETEDTRVRFLDGEDLLEEEMATHSSILAWRIPWIEESDGLQPTGFQRVGHDWIDLAPTHIPVLALKVLHSRTPLSTRNIETVGYLMIWCPARSQLPRIKSQLHQVLADWICWNYLISYVSITLNEIGINQCLSSGIVIINEWTHVKNS